MKKIKICMFTLLFMMSVFALTACRSNNNVGNQSTTQSATQGRETTGAMNGTTVDGRNESRNGTVEESTGVIDGMVGDVERGVNDVLDGTTAETHRADESR